MGNTGSLVRGEKVVEDKDEETMMEMIKKEGIRREKRKGIIEGKRMLRSHINTISDL